MIVVAILVIIGALLYVYSKRVYTFWPKRGVKQLLKPIFPFGNLLPMVKQEICSGDFYQSLYDQTKHEKFVGIYNLLKPVLMVNDVELAKKVLIRDFSHFPDHFYYLNEKEDPYSAHLFALQGDR